MYKRQTGSSRLEAVRRLRRALEELIIEGVKTNREFMHLLTYHKDFIRGNYNTGFWEKNHTEIEKLSLIHIFKHWYTKNETYC